MINRSLSLVVLFALSIGCAIAEQANVIPVDPTYDEFRIVDGTKRFKKHTFLSDMLISNIIWIDDVHLLATIGKGSQSAGAVDANSDTVSSLILGEMVVIDTEAGEIKDFGFEGGARCLVDGNIVISLSRFSTDEIGSRKIAFGKFGDELQVAPYPSEKVMQFNEYDCLYSEKKPVQRLKSIFGQVTKLKAKHGTLISDVTLDDGVKTSELSLLKPSGENIAIPTNVGESNFEVVYIPFDDAYMLAPYLRYDNYTIPWWKTHPKALFVRLLYPNGEVKRIPLPKAIEDKIKDVRHFKYRDVLYTKSGLLWSLTPVSGKSFLSPVYYLQTDNELIKLHDDMSKPSPSGCKLIGSSTASLIDRMRNKYYQENSLQNYYIINLCQGK